MGVVCVPPAFGGVCVMLLGGVRSPAFGRLPSGSLSWDLLTGWRGGFVRFVPFQVAMNVLIKGLTAASKDALVFVAERLHLDSTGKKPAVSRRIIERLLGLEERGGQKWGRVSREHDATPSSKATHEGYVSLEVLRHLLQPFPHF